jgi:hypothetical protein
MPWFFLAMLAITVSCWYVIAYVVPSLKGWLGRCHLAKLEQHTQNLNWPMAIKAMRDARRWAPNNPAVLHASVHLFNSAGGDPRTVISLIRELQQQQAATPEDLALMGRMHVRLNESAKARECFEQIRPDQRTGFHAIQLHADLLFAEGKKSESAELKRSALLNDLQNPESLIQLANSDLRSNDPGRRKFIRDLLWESARGQDALALSSIKILASTDDLTVPQAADLIRLIEAHPDSPKKTELIRLNLLSTQMRLSPQLRQEILKQELESWKDRQPGEMAPLSAWLAAEREYELVLRMIPPQMAVRYTDLLPSYVAALRGTEKWLEFQKLLQPGKIDASFPVQKIRLWQAEVHARHDNDLTRASQTLSLVFEDAGRGKNLKETLEAASLAESMNLWELAQRYYHAVAIKHPHTQQALVPKIYQMAEYQHDGLGMLQACDSLLKLKPDSTPYLLQKLYLQMLLGTEIELAHQTLQNMSLSGSAERLDQIHLLHALSAYRQNQLEELRDTLPKVSKPENLPPGQRTVFAAFLKLSGGDAGRVFRLIERVPPPLLLPEEKIFLQRAL